MSACPSSSMASSRTAAERIEGGPGAAEPLGARRRRSPPTRIAPLNPSPRPDGIGERTHSRPSPPPRPERDVGRVALVDDAGPRRAARARRLVDDADLGVQGQRHAQRVETRPEVGARGRHAHHGHDAAASCDTRTIAARAARGAAAVDRRLGGGDARLQRSARRRRPRARRRR